MVFEASLSELEEFMASRSWVFLLHLLAVGCSSSIPAHPSFEPGICEFPGARPSRLIDISHSYRPDLPVWDVKNGLGLVVELVASMENGSIANQSVMKMGLHTGTHVDAPSHIFQEYYDAGFHVDGLDLDVLNGPALVVDVPRDTNLTAEAMQALNLPIGVERVLFRTLNTDRHLMWKEFDTSYVGFTTAGAKWLRENTKIKLVGIDYLSAASFDSLIPAHVVFLENKDIILVEGLNLEGIDLGVYDLHCLPLKLLKGDGSPIRCVLEK